MGIRATIEREITALTQERVRIGSILPGLRRTVLACVDAVEGARRMALHYRQNLRFIRLHADVVNLDEFTKSRRSWQATEKEVSSSRADLLAAEAALLAAEARLSDASRALDACRAKLAGLGTVIRLDETKQ